MKKVLLTGASGGIGLATAKELINNGYEVYGLDIKQNEEIEHLHFYQVDLTSEKSVNNVFDIIKKDVDEIDAIIHLAGTYDLHSLVEMSEERFKRIFDINVFSVYRVNKTFLPLLNEKGKIVITTSELAPLDPLPFTGIYGITKASLDKYAYSLRMELQLLGYQVVVIRPGATDTGMLNVSTQKIEEFGKTTTYYKHNADKFNDVVNSVESKKIPPQKIGKLVVKILNKKKPKYVYTINRNSLLLMMNVLPRRTQNWAIKKILTRK